VVALIGGTSGKAVVGFGMCKSKWALAIGVAVGMVLYKLIADVFWPMLAN